MKRKQLLVLVVIAVVVAFVSLIAVCGEKKERDREAGTETVQNKKNEKDMPETTVKLPKKITNSIGMEFVYIPPTGDEGFVMGSPLTPEEAAKRYGVDPKRHEDLRPQHKVILTKEFYLQTTEVTQKQWKAITGRKQRILDIDDRDEVPVAMVTWDYAQNFIKRLNRKEQTNKYRLPTEAEWEYACRAGSKTDFYWGDKMDGRYCWYWENSDGKIHPVGEKKPNAWSLYDMAGNVDEWCKDWYGGDYYKNSPEKDPQGPKHGIFRVQRGGTWRFDHSSCRSAERGISLQSMMDAYTGFRVLREAD